MALAGEYTEHSIEQDSYFGNSSESVSNGSIQSDFFRTVRAYLGLYEEWSSPAKQHNYLTTNLIH